MQSEMNKQEPAGTSKLLFEELIQRRWKAVLKVSGCRRKIAFFVNISFAITLHCYADFLPFKQILSVLYIIISYYILSAVVIDTVHHCLGGETCLKGAKVKKELEALYVGCGFGSNRRPVLHDFRATSLFKIILVQPLKQYFNRRMIFGLLRIVLISSMSAVTHGFLHINIYSNSIRVFQAC